MLVPATQSVTASTETSSEASLVELVILVNPSPYPKASSGTHGIAGLASIPGDASPVVSVDAAISRHAGVVEGRNEVAVVVLLVGIVHAASGDHSSGNTISSLLLKLSQDEAQLTSPNVAASAFLIGDW